MHRFPRAGPVSNQALGGEVGISRVAGVVQIQVEIHGGQAEGIGQSLGQVSAEADPGPRFSPGVFADSPDPDESVGEFLEGAVVSGGLGHGAPLFLTEE